MAETQTPITPADEPGHADEERGQLTDIGNALRLSARFEHDLRYVPSHGWLRYEGHRLVKLDGLPLDEACELPKLIRSEVDASHTREKFDAHEKWAFKTSAASRLREALALASDLPTFRTHHTALDRNPEELNTPVGVYDLTDGTLRETLAGDLLTRSTRCKPVPNAAPTFKRFLEQVLPSQDVRNYVQRAVGYSLTGLTKEEVFFILHGKGQNGKSKLMGAIAHALGNYSHSFDPKLIVQQRYEGHPTNIASLHGVRFAYSSEVSEEATLDEGRVKAITGGDVITARFMRKDEFSWSPTHKLWIAVNHLPVIKGTDKGMWRRVVVIPFDVDISDEDRDNDLEDKLKAEASGILAWAIDGAVEYLKHGLCPPVEVLTASDHYKQEQDHTSLYLAEATVEEAGATAKSGDLYLGFKRWCEDNGQQPMNSNAFGRELTRLGFEGATINNVRVRKGLRLIERSWV